MPSVQDILVRLEDNRLMRRSLIVLFVMLLTVAYNFRGYRNMGTQEAMDCAQIARNIAEGRGYTTLFIRPFSLELVKDRYLATHGGEAGTDPCSVKEKDHPDLANAPLYPFVLAGVMKVLPFRYEVDEKSPFWSEASLRPTPEKPRQFWRHQPDFLISLFNQLLFLGVVAIMYSLAKAVFDVNVARLSAVLLLGCEFLWSVSVSGLPVMLLMLIFVSLARCLVWIEREEREPQWRHTAQIWLAIAIGLLLGLGMLTRYSFGWLIVPVLVWLGIFCVLRRWPILITVLGVFLLTVSPWIVRNWMVSGTPFGTAGYALVESSLIFPEHKMERSLGPDFKGLNLKIFTYKLSTNLRDILQNEIPKLGGSWLSFCFLVGLLLGFRSPALKRLRYFLLGVLVTFLIVQSFGRTQITEDSPTLNSENLFALTVPLVFMFGTGLFFLLLDQMNLKINFFRYGVIVVFAILMSLPMIFTLTVAKKLPLSQPYNPAMIKLICGWMKEHELIMSDTPWAVAWYGRRQSILPTLNAQSEFFEVNDKIKPVRALYFTPHSMDVRFVSGWVQPGEFTWPSFILEFMIKKQMPPGFPLRHAPSPNGFLPFYFFVTDSERWKNETSENAAAPSQ